jgi:hypothetical protein
VQPERAAAESKFEIARGFTNEQKRNVVFNRTVFEGREQNCFYPRGATCKTAEVGVGSGRVFESSRVRVEFIIQE